MKDLYFFLAVLYYYIVVLFPTYTMRFESWKQKNYETMKSIIQ